jgi:hypothetical protein
MTDYTFSQRLKDIYRLEVTTLQGKTYRLIAHRKGFPIKEPRWRVLVPPTVNLLWEAIRELRFRLTDRRHWVIDIFETERSGSSEAPVRVIEVPSRRDAFDGIYREARAIQSRDEG